ncbi:MAG: MFS transporter [Acidimicrobiales bacterium]
MTRSPAVANHHVASLGLLTIATYGAWAYGFGVLLPGMTESFPDGGRVLPFGFSGAQLLAGVSGPIIGRTLDRYGSAVIGAIGLVGGLVFVAGGLQQSLAMFVICYVIGGGLIGAAGFYSITQTVVARLSPGAVNEAITRLTIWGAFASPIFVPALAWIADGHGWRSAHVLSGLLVIALFAWMMATVRTVVQADRERRSFVSTLRAELRRPGVPVFLAATVLGTVAAQALIVYQVPLLISAGLGLTTASTYAGARGLAQLLGRLPLAIVVRRIGLSASLGGAYLCLVAAALVVLVADVMPAAVAFAILGGVSIGANSALLGMRGHQLFTAADLGAAMGAMALVNGLAAAVGPAVGGLLLAGSGSKAVAALVVAGGLAAAGLSFNAD